VGTTVGTLEGSSDGIAFSSATTKFPGKSPLCEKEKDNLIRGKVRKK
jgi:hypothetical protein